MNNQNSTFETLKFNPYDSENLLLDNNSDPDENFFKESYFTDTKYFSAEEAKLKLSCSKSNSFSLLHLNIRSLQRNFDKLTEFLDNLDFEFKVICISETWCSENVSCNSLYKIPNYNSIHQIRGNGKAGGGVAMFIHNTLIYNMKPDLSINNDNIEALCIEIVNNNGKNILINTQYRQPAGIYSEFEKYMKDFTNKVKNNGKDLYIVGDMNLNLLDHRSNSKVKEYLNIVSQNLLIPMINKPTRVSKSNATIIDHILTNSFLNTDCSTGIIKIDISDHFPIFLISNEKISENTKHITIQKRVINDQSILYFKEILHEVDWTHLYTLSNPNQAYSYFLRIFSAIYDHAFPVKEMKIKRKTLLNPWMSKGLQKSSKKKTEVI